MKRLQHFSRQTIDTKYFFVEKENGTVLALFALLLFPLMLLTSMAVELSRQTYINTQLAYACDAAAIAGARYSLADVQANASRIFYANYSPLISSNLSVTPTVTLSSDNKYVSVSAVASMPSSFGGITNILSLRVSGFSQVRRDIDNIEVALVLDVTTSMADNNKFAGLKVAAKGLVNAIYENNVTVENTAISIVPFASAVNVGTENKSWLSDMTATTFPSQVPWRGCVAAADTKTVMDTDDPPSVRKWPVYFVPTTYGLYGTRAADNDWRLNSNGTITVMSGSASADDVGPNKGCIQPILPLTNNRDTLLAKIDGLTLAVGSAGTFGNLGIVWGWNTISGRWTNQWPASTIQPKPYSTSTQKSIVIVTDGENSWGSYALPNTGAFSAYGRPPEGKLGITAMSQAAAKINSRVADLCTKMKAQGIQVFTVTFQVSNSTAKNLYAACATKPEWALSADDSDELSDQFFFIANQIKQITIVK